MPTDVSRRGFLASLTLGGSGAFFADIAAGAARDTRALIDVHHHFWSPGLVAGIPHTGLTFEMAKAWTPLESLEDMDRGGVSTAMLSITAPGVAFGGDALALRLSRECNDYAARLVSDHPGRFGSFGVLPWPNVDASLREIEYCLDTLKAEGIGMLTSYGDKWLGDPSFAPVFEELNRRKAVLYTHPTSADCCRNVLPGIPDTAVEYGTDTTRAIARIVFTGASRRYPEIRFVFSHAGGTMPFLAERFVNLAKTTQYAAQLPQGFIAEAAKFYYDTAQSSNPAAMGALRKLIPVSHIVFGTDYPFRTAAEHVKGLKECGVFSAADLRAIRLDNLARLLPRRSV